MGWHNKKFVICVQLAYYVSVCLTQLSVVHEWTSLDVQLPPEYGQGSRRSITPSDVYFRVMYKDRMFVTLSGQPYTLAYLDLDKSASKLLRPYPNYKNRQMINLHNVRVDRCDRLWTVQIVNDEKYGNIIIVFNLKTDSILRKSFIPTIYDSYDMIIDDFDCDNEYVYISNYKEVWTYSWAEDDSWRHISADIIISMILAPNSIVYFNVKYDPIVYYMSTTQLKDKSNKTSDLRLLDWSGKLDVYLYSSALDAKNDVLYYFNGDNKTVIHAAPCWTSERCSLNCQDVSIDPTHELRYITVDENGYLWAITSRYFFEDGEINFRLLSIPVKSTCVDSNANDTTNTSTGVESNAKDTTNTSTGVESNAKYTTNTSTGVESNAKGTTNTMNINEITTAASSTTEQTSTLGSVHKNTTVNIAEYTIAGTLHNINITQAVGGTNMPYLLLFSFTNTTFNFNLSNFTITNFTNNYFQ